MDIDLEVPGQEQSEEDAALEREEEKRLGPPHFPSLFASQVSPDRFSFTFDTPEGPETAWVDPKQMNAYEKDKVLHTGQEISLSNDKRGQSIRFARDVNPDHVLMRYAVAAFRLPDVGKDGQIVYPVKWKTMEDYWSDPVARVGFFLRLHPDVFEAIAVELRRVNGLGLGNLPGGGLLGDSSTASNGNTVE